MADEPQLPVIGLKVWAIQRSVFVLQTTWTMVQFDPDWDHRSWSTEPFTPAVLVRTKQGRCESLSLLHDLRHNDGEHYVQKPDYNLHTCPLRYRGSYWCCRHDNRNTKMDVLIKARQHPPTKNHVFQHELSQMNSVRVAGSLCVSCFSNPDVFMLWTRCWLSVSVLVFVADQVFVVDSQVAHRWTEQHHTSKTTLSFDLDLFPCRFTDAIKIPTLWLVLWFPCDSNTEPLTTFSN